MTVAELITRLQQEPPERKVVLWDPDTDWLLKLLVVELPEEYQPTDKSNPLAFTAEY